MDNERKSTSSGRWREPVEAFVTTRLAGLAIVICFVSAIVLAFLDKAGSAGVVAGLLVVLLLLRHLPEMESFKAFGIEAKLTQRLQEADAVLRTLRRLAMGSANLTYSTLGWGSRMRGLRYSQKQKLADEVDAVLTDLGTSPETVSLLKRDYLLFAACARDRF